MFTFNEITAALTGRYTTENGPVFREAVIDSRQAEKNTLFIAAPGENTDGHAFIGSAFEKGASAALVQEDIPAYPCIDLRTSDVISEIPSGPFVIRVENTIEALQKIAATHRDQLNFEAIGITGTVGKTTTKELVYEVLSQRFKTLKSLGNMNNEIGLPLTLLRADKRIQRAVLEMGFYVAGEIDFLCKIAKPKIGVITNVGTVHAERAGSQEAIAAGKSELVRYLPESGVAILNYDDPFVRPMKEVTSARVFYYGMSPEADLWADEVESFGLEGIRFCLHYHRIKHYLRIPLIGRHSVHTAMRAAAVGLIEGLDWQDIFRGLNYGKSQLRLSVNHTKSGAVIIDDTYNASPDSTLAAINLLHELDGRKIAILGDMKELGQYEIQGHQMVGIRAAEVCDELIAVGPLAKMIADRAIKVGMKKNHVQWFANVSETIDYLSANPFVKGDVVLIKGSHSMQLQRIVEALETPS